MYVEYFLSGNCVETNINELLFQVKHLKIAQYINVEYRISN